MPSLPPACLSPLTSSLLEVLLIVSPSISIFRSQSDVLLTLAYIFQIDGTLSLSSGAAITLSGGLLPENIVWAVADSVTLATTSSFQGTLLAKTQVSVRTNGSVGGRILAQTAVVLQKATVVAPGICGAGITKGE